MEGVKNKDLCSVEMGNKSQTDASVRKTRTRRDAADSHRLFSFSPLIIELAPNAARTRPRMHFATQRAPLLSDAAVASRPLPPTFAHVKAAVANKRSGGSA